MLSRFTLSQKYWFALIFITSEWRFIRMLVLPKDRNELIMGGTLFMVFLILSLLGGWFFGKHLKWRPRNPKF